MLTRQLWVNITIIKYKVLQFNLNIVGYSVSWKSKFQIMKEVRESLFQNLRNDTVTNKFNKYTEDLDNDECAMILLLCRSN